MLVYLKGFSGLLEPHELMAIPPGTLLPSASALRLF